MRKEDSAKKNQERKTYMDETTTQKKETLEINLISAQGLKLPSANLRRMQTYAVVWIDPGIKLRTRIDRVGGDNPTWNDKFLFKVSPDFLSSETSGVSVEIYAVGCLRDPLIGTVRFLISNLPLSSSPIRTPSFVALQIRRPSGRCHGALNIGAIVLDGGGDLAAFNGGVSAIGYRDLMGESIRRTQGRGSRRDLRKPSSAEFVSAEDFFGDNGEELSDGTDSTTSSSSTASTTLKDWNGAVRDFRGLNRVMSAKGGAGGGGLLCGLLMQRRLTLCLSDLNPRAYGESEKENR